MKAISERTQDGGTEVVEAKVGKDATTFSTAYAGAILTDACLKGLNGVLDVVECSFVQSSVTELPFFASKVRPGKNGVGKILGLGSLSNYDKEGLEALKLELKSSIGKRLRLVQLVLKPVMLKRTRSNKESRLILILLPTDIQVIQCKLTLAKKDFYDALFKKSEVKFSQFVEQNSALCNGAPILVLLLQLHHCCDHLIFVISQGEAEKFPICLEAFDDAGLATCARGLCRECLLTNCRSLTTGVCPVSRMMVMKQEHELVLASIQNYFCMDVEPNWMELSKVSALLHELEILRMVRKEENELAENIELLEFKFPNMRYVPRVSKFSNVFSCEDLTWDPGINTLMISLRTRMVLRGEDLSRT
ncbi:hypothetical protein ACH5RR_001045 [Cinchona calisaya]|uniref:Lactate/malate dehydrogenase C-terminal domain-containing protein n=1 Tax=Cinchona calisaya TaxID=153742 RepID=A0ABD3B3H0_9GENT